MGDQPAINTREQIKSIKIESSRERCRALHNELDQMRDRGHLTVTKRRVIQALIDATEAFEDYLAGVENDPDLDVLDDVELEDRIHFAGQHIPVLHKILSVVVDYNVGDLPFELAAPIRREVSKFFPDAEIVVVATPDINYSILDIAEPIRNVFEVLGHDAPDYLPHRVFRVAFPSVEYDQALLHSIFAHEFGHPVYTNKDIESQVLPVDVDNELIKSIYNNIKKGVNSPPNFIEEIDFRNLVTKRVNTTIASWVKEIACDLFAIIFFGPAYLFSFIRLITSIQKLDSGSDSHPPPRLRIRIMIDILDELYSSSKCFSVETSEFIDAWRSIGRSVQDNPNIYMQVAESSLRNANAYEKIKTAVMGSVPKGLVYTEEKYRKDMDGLVEYIYAHVPPVEVANDESIDVTTTTGVLNAGWECFIRGLDDFKATLPNADRLTDHELNVSFNNFILKTMELGEVKRLWRESATDEMGEG